MLFHGQLGMRRRRPVKSATTAGTWNRWSFVFGILPLGQPLPSPGETDWLVALCPSLPVLLDALKIEAAIYPDVGDLDTSARRLQVIFRGPIFDPRGMREVCNIKKGTYVV